MKKSTLAMALPRLREDLAQQQRHVDRLEQLLRTEEQHPWYEDLTQLRRVLREEREALMRMKREEQIAVEAIMKIPDRTQRAALGLLRIDGLTLPEVAEVLKITEAEAATAWMAAYEEMMDEERN